MSATALYVLLTIPVLAARDAGATDLSGQLDAIVEAVAAAHNVEIESIRQARGVARVTATQQFSGDREDEHVDYRVDFCFKGIKTRSDMFSIPPEQSAQPHHIMAFNGQTAFRYNAFAHDATIQLPEWSPFLHELGEDFSPEIFFSFRRNRSSGSLASLAKSHSDKITVQIEDTGLLRISKTFSENVTYHGVPSTGRATGYFLLDPNRGYRIVEIYTDQSGFRGPGSKYLVHLQIQWAEYDKAIYPKQVTYKDVRNYPDAQPNDITAIHKKIVIEQLQPNVEVDDREFTLEGMALKPATLVDDQIAGVLYNYGAPKINEAALEALASGDSARSPTAASPDHNAQESGQPPTSSNPQNARPEETSPPPQRSLLNRAISAIGRGPLITVLAVLCLAACFWAFSRARSRKAAK